MVQYCNLDRVMEARDHFKNGASSKSQMSKENFRKKHNNMQKSLSLLIISILSFCLLSCKKELDVAFDKKAFAYNKKQWEQLNIKDYSFEYQVSCLCFLYPCTIVVREGKIQELIPKDERFAHYIESMFEHYMTIDDLFKVIEKTFNSPMYEKVDKKIYWYCHEIPVEYDETYFYPKFVAFNHKGTMGITDTDVSYRITYFEVE